jgi:diaminopimelate decarboxylase
MTAPVDPLAPAAPAAPEAPLAPAAPEAPLGRVPWWVRPGLEVSSGRLTIAGRDADALARELGTPSFVYDLDRFGENVRRLGDAFARAGTTVRQRFALKANREPEVLVMLRALGGPGDPGSVGIDACSPGEVLHALEHGWRADEISFTGTNVSERDLDVLLPSGVHLNLDAVSQVERVGRRVAEMPAGRRIGLRVNPGAGAGYHEGLAYSGKRPTKFGIYPDRLDEALAVARGHGLTVDTVHMHAGSGWLADGLPAFEDALAATVSMVRHLIDAGCPIEEVNVGGGLGVPARADEQPIDLDAYAGAIARQLGPLGVEVGSEPGDYIAKDTAILLGEVVTVEERGGTTFVGLDIGWNVDCSYFIYRFAQEIVVCRAADAPRTEIVTVAGHINEGGDIFAEEYPAPPIEEGDVVALLNAGGYKQAMSTTHCLRPVAPARFLRRA